MFDAEAFKENERLAWNLCAERYDGCLTRAFAPFSRRLLDLADLQAGYRVLDVASGSGLAAFMAAQIVGPEGRVIGVDLSERMLGLAGKRAAELGVDNVEFTQMDAEELGFPPESFDAVLCALGLMLFPQPNEALSEMRRVLRTGGTAALSVFGTGSSVALRALIDPFIPHMPPPPQRGPSIFGFGRPEVLEAEARAAGFSDVTTMRVGHVLAVDREEGVLEMLLSLGRLAQMYARLPAEAQAQLKEQVYQIARDQYSSPQGALELPFELIYAVARR
jgi:ubiquinone/menaquinone biosynthesis C-methylase UbiE